RDGVHGMIATRRKHPVHGDLHGATIDALLEGVLVHRVVPPDEEGPEGAARDALAQRRGVAVMIDGVAEAVPPVGAGADARARLRADAIRELTHVAGAQARERRGPQLATRVLPGYSIRISTTVLDGGVERDGRAPCGRRAPRGV